MPPVGIICEITEEPLPPGECLACAQADHPRGLCTLEPAMIRQMWEDAENDLGVRITKLTGCLRGSCLEERHPFYYTTDQLWTFFRGRLSHSVVERGHRPEDQSIAEKRLFLTIAGTTVSGQPDVRYHDLKPPKIVDFKSTERLPDQPKAGHVAQLNFYRLLVAEEQPEFRDEEVRLEVLYFTMNSRRRLAAPLWPLDAARAELMRRVRLYLRGREVDGWLPDPLPVEDWFLCGYCAVARHCITSTGGWTPLGEARGWRVGQACRVFDRVGAIGALYEDGIGRRWVTLAGQERLYLLDTLSVTR